MSTIEMKKNLYQIPTESADERKKREEEERKVNEARKLKLKKVEREAKERIERRERLGELLHEFKARLKECANLTVDDLFEDFEENEKTLEDHGWQEVENNNDFDEFTVFLLSIQQKVFKEKIMENKEDSATDQDEETESVEAERIIDKIIEQEGSVPITTLEVDRLYPLKEEKKRKGNKLKNKNKKKKKTKISGWIPLSEIPMKEDEPVREQVIEFMENREKKKTVDISQVIAIINNKQKTSSFTHIDSLRKESKAKKNKSNNTGLDQD